ncbi:MAG: RHS repeat-associated core domain-containing protein, partial [Acidimicrobiales bacterium]
TSASGRALVFGLNSSGLVTTVTDPRSDTWTYTYSGSTLTSVTDPLSRVTSYTYDTTNPNTNLRSDLLTLTQPNGQSGGSSAGAKLTNYYTAGQVTSQVDPMGRTWSYSYTYMNATSGDGVVAVTDPDANVDDYYYKTDILDESVIGAGSSLVSDTVTDPSATTLLVASKTNPDGATTTYTYDSDGNTTSTTNALGEETTAKFNSFDEPTCSTLPMSSSPCSSLSPPSAVSPGGTISVPSAPPAYATYSLYDTNGNMLYTTMGVYAPGGSTLNATRTTYSLHNGNSVTLASTLDQCGTSAPSSSLPCATINANGYVTQLVYDSAGDVLSSATPDGNSSQLATTSNTYDANGDQITTTPPAGNLSSTPANYTTTTTFDADGEPTESVLAAGTGATISPVVTSATYYDPDGNVVESTATGGNPSSCNPVTTQGCAYTTYNEFDADNEKTLVTEPSPTGDVTLTCYDGDGNVAQTVPPAGIGTLTPASCPTSYPSGYNTASPLSGDSTMTTYNAQGNATVVTVPLTGSSTGASTTNVYDGAGQLVESEAPPVTSGGSDVITTSTYDLAGHLLTQTTTTGSSAPSTTSNCYDPDGDTTATVPGIGNASGVAACGTSSPWGTSSSYQTSSSYDSAGELVSMTSPPPGSGSVATTSYTYDAVGNKLTSVIPSSGSGTITTTYTYSPLNQQTSEVTSSGGTALNYTDYYDASGDVLAVTSPGGNPYSSSNTSGCNPVTTSGCSYTTYNTYNSSGQLVTSTNPGGDVTTNYYSSGVLLATTGPSGPGSCNPASATTSSSPCADTMDYFYYPSGQLWCTAEPNTANNTCSSPGSYAGIVVYTYTAATDGQRATMHDSTGTTTYTYDSSNRLISVVKTGGPTVTYGYNQNSDLTCVSYPNASNNTCPSPGSGLGIVTYAYDNGSNQLASMTDWAGNTFTYGYNATGQSNSLSINSSAVTVATGYDNSGNVSSIDASSGATTLLDLGVTRGENSNITVEQPVVGTTTMAQDNFGYNVDNQVNSGPITGSSSNNSYSYVPDGGISTDTNTIASATYNSDDQLCWTSASSSTNGCGSPPTGATQYTFNADGERVSVVPTSGNSAAYGWDSPTGDLLCANTNGSTCSTSSPTSSTTVYSYNGDGLRATSTIGSTTTNYTWGQIGSNPQLLSDGTWDYVYVPGSSVPVEQVAASGSSPAADLLLSDPNGSVRGIVQLTSGTHQDQLVNYTDYDAYGNPITQSGGSVETGGLTATQTSINSNYVATTPFGFGGGYTDATGLIYLVHRYYDPVTGQFLSIDPDLATTNQPYAYVGDDPVNGSDPSGDIKADLSADWISSRSVKFSMAISGLWFLATLVTYTVTATYYHNNFEAKPVTTSASLKPGTYEPSYQSPSVTLANVPSNSIIAASGLLNIWGAGFGQYVGQSCDAVAAGKLVAVFTAAGKMMVDAAFSDTVSAQMCEKLQVSVEVY